MNHGRKRHFVPIQGCVSSMWCRSSYLMPPATFQRLIETVLEGLARKECVAYLDDILVIGESLKNIWTTSMGYCRGWGRQGLDSSQPSATLLRKVLRTWGTLSNEGIVTDHEKMESVKNFPVPASTKHLQSFLGQASYYCPINGFLKVAAPLFALTCKDVLFVCDNKCHKAFVHLKKLLTSAPC